MSSRIEIASGIRHLLFWRAAAEAEIQSLIATPIPQLHAARSTVPNLQIHSPSFSGSGRAAGDLCKHQNLLHLCCCPYALHGPSTSSTDLPKQSWARCKARILSLDPIRKKEHECAESMTVCDITSCEVCGARCRLRPSPIQGRGRTSMTRQH